MTTVGVCWAISKRRPSNRCPPDGHVGVGTGRSGIRDQTFQRLATSNRRIEALSQNRITSGKVGKRKNKKKKKKKKKRKDARIGRLQTAPVCRTTESDRKEVGNSAPHPPDCRHRPDRG